MQCAEDKSGKNAGRPAAWSDATQTFAEICDQKTSMEKLFASPPGGAHVLGR
jgi:hypothetical protein